MTRSPRARLEDILASCMAISHHLDHLDANEDIVFDAIRVRLIEIGEAAKDLPSEVTDPEPSIPWMLITKMRDHLAHRYFDTSHAIVLGTARNDVVALEAAVRRILASG